MFSALENMCVVEEGVRGEVFSTLENIYAGEEEFEERCSQCSKIDDLLVIGCAISASDGSSPQVYVRLLAVGHRLERDISSIASLRISSTQSFLIVDSEGG